MNSIRPGPFELLPELAWEVLFAECIKVDPEIVHALFLAFPELDSVFGNKKKCWLFGAVLPLLLERDPSLLGRNDALSCRAVCRSWRTAVHWYLDGEPWVKPLLLELPAYRDVNRRESIWNRRLLVFDFDNDWGLRFLPKCHAPLSEAEKKAVSPQLYRSVEVSLMAINLGDEGDVRGKSILARFMGFLRNFGRCVWSLQVYGSYNDFAYAPPRLLESWSETWKEAFGLVPNLKELVFIGCFPFKLAAIADGLPRGIVSLGMRAHERVPVTTGLFDKILSEVDLAQLRCLSVSFENLRFGDLVAAVPLGGRFVNLAKLDLKGIGPQDSRDVKILLGKGLDAPNLAFLKLGMTRGGQEGAQQVWDKQTSFWIEEHVFHWLCRFPRLRALKLNAWRSLRAPILGGALLEPPKLPGAAIPLSFPLRYLYIKINEALYFQFLRYLSNLKVLVIRLEEDDDGDDDVELGSDDDSDGDMDEENDEREGRDDDDEGEQPGFEVPELAANDEPWADFMGSAFYGDGIWETAKHLSRVTFLKLVNYVECKREFDRWNYQRAKFKAEQGMVYKKRHLDTRGHCLFCFGNGGEGVVVTLDGFCKQLGIVIGQVLGDAFKERNPDFTRAIRCEYQIGSVSCNVCEGCSKGLERFSLPTRVGGGAVDMMKAIVSGNGDQSLLDHYRNSVVDSDEYFLVKRLREFVLNKLESHASGISGKVPTEK